MIRRGQTVRCSDPPMSPAALALGGLHKRDSRALPYPSAIPGLPALLLRRGARIAMGVCKREPTIDELLSDPLMVTVLQHARTTPDDVRAMMRDARERLARARAAGAEGPTMPAATTNAGVPDGKRYRAFYAAIF